MKNLCKYLMILCLLLALTACTNSTYEEPVGDDWHVWGMYDFVTVGDTTVAIGRAFDDDNRHVGFDIYADGKSQGPLLGELRFSDGERTVEDFDLTDWLVLEDRSGDGLVDIGVKASDGAIIWYLQDEIGGFTFAETEKGADAP